MRSLKIYVKEQPHYASSHSSSSPCLLLTVASVFVPQSNGNLTRLTNTPEHAVNLNPTLSDDGRIVVFESSADLVRARVQVLRFMRFARISAAPAFVESRKHARRISGFVERRKDYCLCFD